MSRHHAAHAGDVTHILNDLEHMSQEEGEKLYGIEIRDDGSVFDPTYNRNFGSKGEWAEFSVAQDEFEYEEDINRYSEGHGRYT